MWTYTYVHTPTQPQGPRASLPHGLSRSARFGTGAELTRLLSATVVSMGSADHQFHLAEILSQNYGVREEHEGAAQGPEKPEEELEKDFVSQVPSNASRASVALQLLHVSARSPSPPGSVSRGLATPAGPAFVGCWAPDQPAWRVSPLFSSFLTPDPPFVFLTIIDDLKELCLCR